MPSRRERTSILVVDDHPQDMLALRETLARDDQRVFEARSGAEALRQTLKHEFALIVMDVAMPHLDGLETARLLRQRDASRHIPIIFLTAAGADVAALYKGYALGAVDYLVKPVDPHILRAKVDVFVELHRRERAIREREEGLHEVQRKRSEQALAESEALYGTTFNKVAIGIAHATNDGRWTRVNQQFCDVLGYSRDQLLQLRIQDVVYPSDVLKTLCALRQLVCGDLDEYHAEVRYARRDGSVIWVHTALSVLRDASGAPKHLIAAIEDFTERKLTEERQRFLASASETLLSSLDDEATLAQVAQAAVPAVADLCLLELVGRGDGAHFAAVVHADPARQSLARQMKRWLETGEHRAQALAGGPGARLLPQYETARCPLLEREGAALAQGCDIRSWASMPLVARDQLLGTIALGTCGPGARRYGQADMRLLEDLAQRIAFAVDHARLYRAAQEAVSARDEFLSVASHELRTPLTPLQIRFQWLLSERSKEPLENVPPERLRGILEQCERQVRRLGMLVDNLLDVSRLSAGVLRLNSEPCDLGDLVRDVAARLSEELLRSQCALELLAEREVIGYWDRLRVEQAVHNLLSNAIKYGAGKPIRLEVRQLGDRAQVTITDQGIGIDPDKVARIFGRFERAASARAYGGLGLGLYLVHQIVTAHAGEVHVRSLPGAGSVFTLELPLAIVPGHANAPSAPSFSISTH